ncbi:MAG: class I mannose-6-phosphate isomerase [Acidobacteriota bacterium]|jgi:mannose-6-phosphate isomerase class I|nr:class I mannose-6-phosphate isomerase [Acidobacteriota bacterium]
MSGVRAPLVFKPVYKDYLWGGTRLASVYGRRRTPAVCAESWEVSAHPGGESVVASGRFAGRGLAALATTYGAALVGARAPEPTRFPLLFKLIDARDRLSVQVHPNGEGARRLGGEPKTEMWVVLDRAPGASLYAGLAAGTTPASLRAALDRGDVEARLVELPVEPGQALFIPGGLVHAIGAGCLVYEVQQSSDTTYRLFDWNRVGADGKPRPLHIEEGLQAIDWSLPAPRMVAPASGDAPWLDLAGCEFFRVRRLDLATTTEVAVDGTSFHALFVARGRVDVRAGGESVALAAGASALVPADAGAYALTPAGPSTLLVTTM